MDCGVIRRFINDRNEIPFILAMLAIWKDIWCMQTAWDTCYTHIKKYGTRNQFFLT